MEEGQFNTTDERMASQSTIEELERLTKEREEKTRETVDSIFNAAMDLVGDDTQVRVGLGLGKGELRISDVRNMATNLKTDEARIQILDNDGKVVDDLVVKRNKDEDWKVGYADYSGDAGQRVEWRKAKKGKKPIDMTDAMTIVPEIKRINKVLKETAYS